MNNGLVSIIVSCFNAELYLKECVTSILNQTYKEIEIILVDDGSADDTLSICREFEANDSRIHVLKKCNGGLSSARNAGFQISHGEWIWFIDSDDYIKNDAVETLLQAAVTTNSDCAIADFQPFDSTGFLDRSGYIAKDFPSGIRTGFGLLQCLINGEIGNYVWTMLLNRSLLNELDDGSGPFINNYRFLEDAVFAHRLARMLPTVIFVNCPMYFYRQVSSSLLHKTSLSNAEEGLKAVKYVSLLQTPDQLIDQMQWLCISWAMGVDSVAGFSPDADEFHAEIASFIKMCLKRCGHYPSKPSLYFKCIAVKCGFYSLLKKVAKRSDGVLK